MTKTWRVAILGVFMAAAFVCGTLFNRRNSDSANAGQGPRVLYYRDPMHPSYTSGKPGIAPDCGMALEPVYADAQGSAPSAMRLSPVQQQNIGIRIAKVDKSAVTLTFRALGRVVTDEARTFPLIAGADGWVRQIFPVETGSIVRKGQPLVDVYGTEFMNVQRAYLYALRNLQTAPRGAAGDYRNDPKIALQEARVMLQNMGFDEAQIEQLGKASQVSLNVTLPAPAAGVIVTRNAFPQQRFERGAELFRIADLSSVWIVADLFGDDARHLQPGATAHLTLPDRPREVFPATVTKTLPRFDAETRTLQVRLEAPNPALTLRPGMFVDILFPVRFPAAITVPADAVVESGLKKTVFVEESQGIFKPRTVETGWRFSDRVEIVRGLDPGESIVVSGNFLLDSERRIPQGAARAHD